MSQWIGAARSNYVKIVDMPALLKALEPWPDVRVHQVPNETNPDSACFLVDSGEGWPNWGTVEDEDGEEREIEFNVAEHVCPFMAPGQVLVMMESGHEKLCYVSGNAQAYHSDGRRVLINIADIYEKAAAEFGISEKDIGLCEY